MRLIDADALMKVIREAVDEAPTIDAVPVVRGEWVAEQKSAEYCEFTCFDCGFSFGETDEFSEWIRYCPNCGARMGGHDAD